MQTNQERLRHICYQLRATSIPLKDIIPLLQSSADLIDVYEAKLSELAKEVIRLKTLLNENYSNHD